MKENNLIDLHTHTTFSDGDNTPEELVNIAINNGVGTLAITDHNTTDGLKVINKEQYKDKIQIINGIELSSYSKTGRLHILGLGIDIYNSELNRKIEMKKSYSINKLITILEQIKRDYHIVFSEEDIKNIINSECYGRPSIAKLCVKYGYATDIEDAFQKYLNPAYKKTKDYNQHLMYEECFSLIKNSGGIPIIAHPKSLGLSEKEFLLLIKEMIKCGLEGIEAYHYTHTPEEMAFYEYVANQNGLYTSVGSDYHGPITKPDVQIGTGYHNNLNIRELKLLQRLK